MMEPIDRSARLLRRTCYLWMFIGLLTLGINLDHHRRYVNADIDAGKLRTEMRATSQRSDALFQQHMARAAKKLDGVLR